MTDSNFSDRPGDRDQQRPQSEVTHRFDDAANASPSPQRETAGPGLVARVATISLIVGVLAGVAGAAGYSAVDDLGGNDASISSPAAESPNTAVSTSQDTNAEDGSVEQVASSVLNSVVKINVSGSQGSGSGSGIILSEDGEILTNNHVVGVAEDGGRIAVSFPDGTSAPAEVVGTDPLTDLAVIQAEGVSGLTPATLGRSGQLDVGEIVVAIGSPFGLEATVTSGIVSALQRPVSVSDSSQQSASATTYPAIQTDAAINPGNSGGPLVNMRGEVVGVNSSIRTASSGTGSEGGSIGLGFAIPIDNVLPIVDQLRNEETPTHARLGVSVENAASSDGLLSGARVASVEAGSAADEAGLEKGDVITRVGNQLITDSESLVATIRGQRPGDDVSLTVVPGGSGAAETIGATLDSDEGVASS
ncbi:MAG: trypsin-like peptidase domain-containing protein [Nocardioidaceae bacterium]|nr:trypsin-like peptidase domain-containing protein [Nocardioidaceae bacterium]